MHDTTGVQDVTLPPLAQITFKPQLKKVKKKGESLTLTVMYTDAGEAQKWTPIMCFDNLKVLKITLLRCGLRS